MRLEDEDAEAEADLQPEQESEQAQSGAEAAGEEEEDDGTRNHAWFVVYADVPEPSILVMVVVDDGDSGATVAGPIARTVLERTIFSGWAPVLD